MTRGEAYRVQLPARRGHEQAATRHALSVQTDELLGLSTAIVAPTSRSAAPATFRPAIQLGGETTRVRIEQLRALDIERLDQLAGRISAREQQAVDDALALVLGLS